MRRREFIKAIAGSATAWPLASAHAEQVEHTRRIGAIMGFRETDTEGSLWLSSFTRALLELGWTEGRNVIIDVRWSASNVEREQLLAKELVALQPDVILAHGTPITAALKRETRTIPIVFGAVADPVGEGFVESLNCPGGNITGFLFSEASIGASGSNCSRKSPLISNRWPCFSIQKRLLVEARITWLRFRTRRDRLK